MNHAKEHNPIIADNVRSMRGFLRMTRNDLVMATGLSDSAVRRIEEHGHASYTELVAVAEALGVSAKTLGREPRKPRPSQP